jgi:hypothetical protein
MGMRQTASSLGLMLFVVGAFFAQEGQQANQFEAKPAPLPTGNNVWSIRMVRSGGFAGSMLTATLTSDGKVACLSCADRNVVRALPREDLLAIVPSSDMKAAFAGNKSVREIKPGQKVTLAPSASCRDCLVTVMTVQHRDGKGKVKTYLVSWDDLSASGAPAELVQLAKSIVTQVR